MIDGCEVNNSANEKMIFNPLFFDFFISESLSVIIILFGGSEDIRVC